MFRPVHRRPRSRILVVDDDPGIRDLLDDVLTGEGYNVIVAPDGADALSLALERAPDLILLDLTMPRMGGEDFCRAYRERGGNTPIVLVSAAPGAERLIGECSAEGLISKPFELETLLEATARHLSRVS